MILSSAPRTPPTASSRTSAADATPADISSASAQIDIL
jgi:hypothetical protein